MQKKQIKQENSHEINKSILQLIEYLICFTIISIFFCCNNHEKVSYKNVQIEKKKFISKTIFDKNGDTLIYELLNKDSIKDGFYKEIISNKFIYSGDFNLGKKEGKWVKTNIEGDTIKVENWFTGKKFGEQFEYYIPSQNNKVLNLFRYNFINLEGEDLFRMKFDSNKSIAWYRGFPIYCVFNKGEISKGDNYELICFWGCPSPMHFKLTIKEFYKNKAISIKEIDSVDTLNFQHLDYAKKILIEKKYELMGKYTWDIHLRLFDNYNNSCLVNDSILTNLIVN